MARINIVVSARTAATGEVRARESHLSCQSRAMSSTPPAVHTTVKRVKSSPPAHAFPCVMVARRSSWSGTADQWSDEYARERPRAHSSDVAANGGGVEALHLPYGESPPPSSMSIAPDAPIANQPGRE